MTALILAGGDLTVTPRVLERSRGATLVVAADGGARHAAALGLTVDLWVGDFDSSPRDLQRALAGTPRETHPTDKNRVDSELALETARARGAGEALILGAFGGRFDHALALVTIAARWTLDGFPVALDSGDQSGWPLVPGRTLELPLEAGQVFSVIALSTVAAGLRVGGARWPLHRAELPFGSGWGVSNEATGPVQARLEAGLAVVIVNHG